MSAIPSCPLRDRRYNGSSEQAITYLESLPLLFLTQIRDSLRRLNQRQRERVKPKTKKAKGKGRKKRKKPVSSEGEDDDKSGSEAGSGGSHDPDKQGGEVDGEGEVGVTLKLMNRTTG